MIKKLIQILSLSTLFFSSYVFAEPIPHLSNPAPGAGTTLKDFVFLLIKIIQMIAVPAIVMIIIYAGYLMVSAAGNEDQITASKKWFLWAVVGAGIILGATTIANIVYGTASQF